MAKLKIELVVEAPEGTGSTELITAIVQAVETPGGKIMRIACS